MTSDERSDTFHEQRRSFDSAAEIYERARPSYPAEAVDWLLGDADEHDRDAHEHDAEAHDPHPAPRHVIDLGAGTGKLTRLLVERGIPVTAVEPAERMLEQLTASLPDVPVHVGTAESIPLPDASADLVLVAQAWHWVDETRALPEVARVLRPGGALGLVWNIRDESVAWVRRLSELMGNSAAETTMQSRVEIGEPFGETHTAVFPWTRTMTTDSLIELAMSRSYVITAAPERQAQLAADLREFVAREPDLDPEGFEMPYRTHVYRAELAPARDDRTTR